MDETYKCYSNYHYQFKKQDKKIFINSFCFGDIWKIPTYKVYYHVDIDESISSESLSFYLRFLKGILGDENFKFRKGKDITSLFILDSYKLTVSQTNLHLTLFRYLQEFPELVEALYNRHKEDSIEVQFTSFYQLHFASINKKYNNLSGHGITSLYGKRNPDLTLAWFKKRFNKFTSRVCNFFVD